VVDERPAEEQAAFASRLDIRLRHWLDEAVALARNTLGERRAAVEALAVALVEEESVDGTLLEGIMKGSGVDSLGRQVEPR
jgi:ATP-dependent Zn protease